MAFFCLLILQKLPTHLSTVRLLKSTQKRMEQPLKENLVMECAASCFVVALQLYVTSSVFFLQIFVSDSTGEVGSENKMLEDTTVGSADGPVSLDVRRPQKTRKVRRLL